TRAGPLRRRRGLHRDGADRRRGRRTRSAAAGLSRLPKLAVLAAAAVDADGPARGIAGTLAGDAGAYAGERAAPRFGDAFAALVAMLGAVSAWRLGAGAQHRVLDRVVDLILHRAV